MMNRFSITLQLRFLFLVVTGDVNDNNKNNNGRSGEVECEW